MNPPLSSYNQHPLGAGHVAGGGVMADQGFHNQNTCQPSHKLVNQIENSHMDQNPLVIIVPTLWQIQKI